MNIINKGKSLVGDFRKYWKIPPKGRYMSFKEIASLSVGGIGSRLITHIISQMILSVGNVLIGNTIGIEPGPLYVIYVIGILSGFPLTALRANLIDNVRSMKGKYRPYILTMGLPTVILGSVFIWMPYEGMKPLTKCIVVLGFNIAFQFFYNFYCDSYDSLINVLSPNSIERSDVLSIKSVIENISPSIYNIFLPLVAKAITGQNTIYDLKIYRVLFPPLLFASFMLSLLIYLNTEEKIVQAKTHVIQVKFVDAFRAIARNKYFWIISLAGWLGFLESSFNNIMGWMYNYQNVCSGAQYSLITAIAGNASFWPNLMAPFLIRKYGKKKILVFTNVLNIGFIALMLPIVRITGQSYIIWLLLVCTFVNTLITSLGHLLTPSINADIRDYQQYITGERIDGMFSAVGLIGNVITLATGSVLPIIYERSGLNTEVAISLGYDGSNVYDVLNNADYFVQISSVLVIASVVGAIMNVIPFFFYDLTETRQKAMVKVLKIRAVFEDYGNNVLSDESLIEAIEIIREAKEFANMEISEIDSDKVKKSSASKKEARATLRQMRETNENIQIAAIIMQELNQFETEYGISRIASAKKIVEAGLYAGADTFGLTKEMAKTMPKTTEAEKERRRDAFIQISNMKASKKAIAKYFPDGIKEFDNSVFEQLFKEEDELAVKVNDVIKALKTAKESKDKELSSKLKEELKELHIKQSLNKREIKAATDKYSIYYRAAKPYLDAVKLLKQKENYEHLDDIEALYDEAKARYEAKEANRLSGVTE